MSGGWRDRVVAEALTWAGTPYHHQGAVKGAGVDCAFLLTRVYAAAGLVPLIDPRPYAADWFMHRGEEVFRGWVDRFALPLQHGSTPGPGDLLLMRFGRCYSHGAIVLAWPRVIHAVRINGCVCIDDLTRSPDAARPRLFYTFHVKP